VCQSRLFFVQVLSTANVTEEDMLPLTYFERAPPVYKMLLHAVWTPEVLVTFSPGAGTFVMECIARRMPCIIVVSSEEHKQLVLGILREQLLARCGNSADERFFRPPPVAMPPQSENSSPKKPAASPAAPAPPAKAAPAGAKASPAPPAPSEVKNDKKAAEPEKKDSDDENLADAMKALSGE
jgi:hypothetical protein